MSPSGLLQCFHFVDSPHNLAEIWGGGEVNLWQPTQLLKLPHIIIEIYSAVPFCISGDVLICSCINMICGKITRRTNYQKKTEHLTTILNTHIMAVFYPGTWCLELSTLSNIFKPVLNFDWGILTFGSQIVICDSVKMIRCLLNNESHF